jgi:hypothetical protein
VVTAILIAAGIHVVRRRVGDAGAPAPVTVRQPPAA